MKIKYEIDGGNSTQIIEYLASIFPLQKTYKFFLTNSIHADSVFLNHIYIQPGDTIFFENGKFFVEWEEYKKQIKFRNFFSIIRMIFKGKISIVCTPKQNPSRHIDETIKVLCKQISIDYFVVGYCGKWNGKQFDSAVLLINEADLNKVKLKFFTNH